MQDKIKHAEFSLYEEAILSGQVAQECIPGLLRSNPEFESWYIPRRGAAKLLAENAGEGEI